MLSTISYSDSAYVITTVEPLKATLYDHFRILVYISYFIFIKTTINFKFKTAKFGFSIFDIFALSFS